MAKTPTTDDMGKRRALEEALEAVERLGRAAARRAPKPNPEPKERKPKVRAGSGESGETPTRNIVAFPPRFAAIPRV